ncbi:hypothetical protein BBP40_000320 [Aspergillus hancockii]|nr:hypothetical protein BBP40_000320 [Aspergillus hancockii]
MGSITVVQPNFLWGLGPNFPPLSSCFSCSEGEKDINPYEAWSKCGNGAPEGIAEPIQPDLSQSQPLLDTKPFMETGLPVRPSALFFDPRDDELEGNTQFMVAPSHNTTELRHTFMKHRAEGNDWKSRRDKVLQRNRQAAKRCRQRKKHVVEEIESLANAHAWRNNELRVHIEQLRYELLDLHGEILKHAQCDDEPIKRYLRQRVRKISEDHTANAVNPEPIDPQLVSSSLAARSGNVLSSGTGSCLGPYNSLSIGTQAFSYQDTAQTEASSGEQTTDRTLFEMISF